MPLFMVKLMMALPAGAFSWDNLLTGGKNLFFHYYPEVGGCLGAAAVVWGIIQFFVWMMKGPQRGGSNLMWCIICEIGGALLIGSAIFIYRAASGVVDAANRLGNGTIVSPAINALKSGVPLKMLLFHWKI